MILLDRSAAATPEELDLLGRAARIASIAVLYRQVLKLVAERLRTSVPLPHTVARLSGPTFVVVWRGVPDRTAAETLARAILRHSTNRFPSRDIETNAELELITPLSPDLLQGFLFHRPMSSAQAEELLPQLRGVWSIEEYSALMFSTAQSDHACM
jgi:predicted signal transduction protein with EAL and GGDEF domain